MIQEDRQQVEKSVAARRRHRVTRLVLTRPSVGARGQTPIGDHIQRPLMGDRKRGRGMVLEGGCTNKTKDPVSGVKNLDVLIKGGGKFFLGQVVRHLVP